MNLHIIYSSDNCSYQAWQSELLFYSFQKIGHPGKLTQLLSTKKDEVPLLYSGASYKCLRHSIDDHYPPYNKPYAISQWLKNDIKEDFILIIDPDCIFRHIFTENYCKIGIPLTHDPHFFNFNNDILKRHCSKTTVESVCIPTLIRVNDLREIADLWFSKTVDIRKDDICRDQAGWCAEMWGYSIACAEKGIKHLIKDFQITTCETIDKNVPIIHYAYEINIDNFKWDKRTYKPWTKIEYPKNTKTHFKFLFDMINEFNTDYSFC